jgi:hypothetical protein
MADTDLGRSTHLSRSPHLGRSTHLSHSPHLSCGPTSAVAPPQPQPSGAQGSGRSAASAAPAASSTTNRSYPVCGHGPDRFLPFGEPRSCHVAKPRSARLSVEHARLFRLLATAAHGRATGSRSRQRLAICWYARNTILSRPPGSRSASSLVDTGVRYVRVGPRRVASRRFAFERSRRCRSGYLRQSVRHAERDAGGRVRCFRSGR